ncbi:MAG: heme biosynthesis HemY N-terminal domain-containing protein [Pseudomonadota bacterium]
MLRVLAFLVVVAALGSGFAWLAERPGTVSIDWMGFQIEISAMAAMVAFVGLIFAIMIAWWLLKSIIRSPQMMGGYFSARRRDKGYAAVSDGLVAAGSGDAAATQKFAKAANKYLPGSPLTRVLSASSADLNEDKQAKRICYRKMLDEPKTQLLGLRGLYLDAVEEDDEEAARHYAAQAAALAPSLAWAGVAQFEDQVQRADWAAARTALERNLGARIVTRKQRNRLRAVLLTAEALDLEAGQPETARELAAEAHKLAADLVPAAAICGRLLIRANKMTQASKVLEASWKLQPHPEIAEVYLYVRPGDAVADRVKRARKLAMLCAHAVEGEMVLSRALLEAGELDEARACLKPFIGDEATQRACLLMAEIEERAGGDTAAVRGWMARALRAKRDPAWVADGYVSSTWEPISPLSGRLDAFEWKVPVERFSGHDPVAIPSEAMGDDGQMLLPARFPALEAATAMTASQIDISDAELVDAGPATPNQATPNPAATSLVEDAEGKTGVAEKGVVNSSATEQQANGSTESIAEGYQADSTSRQAETSDVSPAVEVEAANDDTKPTVGETTFEEAAAKGASGEAATGLKDGPEQDADDDAYDGNPRRRFRLF